jgi:hypothetical protein
VHFMGALDDDHFLAGMAICDVVVMPYLEVGQSASGPMSQSLELGCRTIASRNQTFLQLSRYHKDRIEFFEIGNHLELAERIIAPPQYAADRRLAFNTETNKAVYVAANSRRRWPRGLLSAARRPFASSRYRPRAGSVAPTAVDATPPPP